MIKFLCRLFIKLTGLPPFYFVSKQMKFYSSSLTKAQRKEHKKEGTILVSNHTSVLDYYSFIYLYFFKNVKTFVSELLYKNPFMRFLNYVMGNILIDRRTTNLNSLVKAEKLLKKNKTLLIFPEGHIEKEKGKIEEFHESAVILAFRTHSAIVPHYISGDFSLLKRNRIMIGEKIYVNDLVKKEELSKEDIEYCLDYIKKEILKLKSKVDNIKKIDTNTIFTKKYWMNDLAKWTTFPLRQLLWNTKIYYLGNKKEIKKALKYNCLLSSNHIGRTDVFFLYLYFMKRRVRIIAADTVYKKKFFRFCLEHSNAIKFNISATQFDYIGFKDAINTLDANGVVGIYPEGHLNTKKEMLKINEGLALLSLYTNSPIIPIYHLNEYRYFRRNKVAIGNVIYPDNNKIINKEIIDKYNDKIIFAFNNLKKRIKTICQMKK